MYQHIARFVNIFRKSIYNLLLPSLQCRQQYDHQMNKEYVLQSKKVTSSLTAHSLKEQRKDSLSRSPFISHLTTSTTESLRHSTSSSTYSASQLDSLSLMILHDLNQYGICVIDQFLPNGDPVLNEVLQLYSAGTFSAGQVVSSSAASAAGRIRGDQVVWLRGSENNCQSIGQLMATFDELIGRCNKHKSKGGEFNKYDISGRTKAMVACYPSNFAKYVRHVDNPNGDGRCVTAIYYLNKNYDRTVFFKTLL